MGKMFIFNLLPTINLLNFEHSFKGNNKITIKTDTKT